MKYKQKSYNWRPTGAPAWCSTLQRPAEPYLAWGAEAQRYVRIALESVALPDQSLTHFRRGRTGRLWQLRVGEADVLVLLAEPAGNPAGISSPEDLAGLVDSDVREAVVARLKELGFTYVTLDLQGFRSGSMNEPLAAANKGAEHS